MVHVTKSNRARRPQPPVVQVERKARADFFALSLLSEEKLQVEGKESRSVLEPVSLRHMQMQAAGPTSSKSEQAPASSLSVTTLTFLVSSFHSPSLGP